MEREIYPLRLGNWIGWRGETKDEQNRLFDPSIRGGNAKPVYPILTITQRLPSWLWIPIESFEIGIGFHVFVESTHSRARTIPPREPIRKYTKSR